MCGQRRPPPPIYSIAEGNPPPPPRMPRVSCCRAVYHPIVACAAIAGAGKDPGRGGGGGGGGTEGQNWSVKIPASMRHFKFRGLTPGATYVVAVRACGVGGWGRRAAMRLTTPGVTNFSCIDCIPRESQEQGAPV